MSTWDNTAEGQRVRDSWTRLLTAYNQGVPGHVQRLQTLSNRPIGG